MTDREPPALFFHPDAIEGEGRALVGRRSAGQSFVQGFLRHMPGPHVNVVTETDNAAKAFEATARAMGETRQIKANLLRGDSDFTRAGTVFFPAPGYLNAAWRRQRFGPANCSLVGITHTVSTRRIIESLHTLLAEPVEAWDAIICTSRAVQSVVARQFALEAEYYRARFGAVRVPQPRLPVIPLGIDAATFARSDALRAEARARFDVPQDAVVVMTVGRWTSVEKANPVPLFMALEQVAGALGKPVHLWMVGWSARDEETALHQGGAARLCPAVTTRMIDGRDAWARRALWSGADIFTLPVDNIQETFGLVPVEAMAAGLPVVMPDWDGFRDTVVDGETGFLTPTLMAPPGDGGPIAARFADGTDDYIRYLAMVLQHTVIDVPAYADAILRLAENPALRARMGAAGAAHVRQNFDLAAVIPRYADLAEELADLRRGATPTTPRAARGPVNPLEVDPFDLYRAYPTRAVTPLDVVTHRRPLDAETLAGLDAVNGRTLYRRKVVGDATVIAVAARIAADGPMTLAELAVRTGLVLRVAVAAALFLAKQDFVSITAPMPK